MRIRTTACAVAIEMLCLVGVALAQDASLDDAWKALPAYKLGQSRAALETIQKAVVASQQDPAKRAAMAAKLASFLPSAEATYEAKDFCCRQLYIIGGKAEIPAVARLLADEKLSHMSRYVLEALADPDADAAMRDALPNLRGKLLIGVINSLGNRHDAKATDALAKMLGGNDPTVAAAAASALGKIGGEAAIKALAAQLRNANAEVKQAAVDAYLLAADQLLVAGQKEQSGAMFEELIAAKQPMRIRMAALRGLVAAQPGKAMPLVLENLRSADPASVAMACGFARQIQGADVAKALAAALPTLSPGAQVLLMDALASRGDAAARPAIAQLIRSDDAQVKTAAVQAIGSLGDASDVPMLVALAAKNAPERQAARQSLARLKGAAIDPAITTAMANASADAKVECIKALAARRATGAMPVILEVAKKDNDESVRSAAIESCGSLIEDKDFPVLVDLLLGAKSDSERKSAESAVAAASLRMKDRAATVAPIITAMDKAPVAAKKVLLNALAKMGGTQPLEAVRAAVKSDDAEVRVAAVRCLTQWPDAAAIPDMMAIAKGDDQNLKVLAFRGIVDVSRRTPNRPAAENLKLYRDLLGMASTARDRNYVIAGISDVKDAGALDLLTPMLSDNEVKAEAATAVIKVAKSVGARGAARARKAIQAVIDANISPTITDQAKQAMK